MNNKFKDQMSASMDDSYSSRGGSGYINFISTQSLDEDVTFLNTKKGSYEIGLVPFEVATDNHPKRGKGEFSYNLDVWVHKKIGIEQGTYICLKETYGKKCPICEAYFELKNSGADEEDYEYLKAKRRAVYNVLDLEDNTVKLFNTSYPLFEKEWLEERHECQNEGEIITPYYGDGGYYIRFRDTGVMGLGRFKGFKFVKITEEIKDSVYKKAIPLDTLLVIPTYEQLKAVFENKAVSDDEEKPKTTKEIEEEPKVVDKKPETDSENECPYDLKFGKDFEAEDVCDDCEKWRECKKANRELK